MLIMSVPRGDTETMLLSQSTNKLFAVTNKMHLLSVLKNSKYMVIWPLPIQNPGYAYDAD